MTITGLNSSCLSNIYQSSALKSIHKAAALTQTVQYKNKTASEMPVLKADIQPSGSNILSTMDEAQKRDLFRCMQPTMVAGMLLGGEWSTAKKDQRGEYNGIVEGYFNDIKTEFGVDDNYMPYFRQLPEYDEEITKQMSQELEKRISEDARAMELIGMLNITFPPPKNLDTVTPYGDQFYDLRKGLNGFKGAYGMISKLI